MLKIQENIIKKSKSLDKRFRRQCRIQIPEEVIVLEPFAKVKNTKGYKLISNNTDFEKAYTNFTIRYPKVEITRDMNIIYNNKKYSIEYLNNVDEENIELEIQAKVVNK